MPMQIISASPLQLSAEGAVIEASVCFCSPKHGPLDVPQDQRWLVLLPSLAQPRGLEPRQVPACPPLKSRSGCDFCWLQLSAAQNGKCSPFSLCTAVRKTEQRFCLGCSQSCLLGIAHGPGMWLFGAQARITAIFPLKTRGK